MYFIGIFAESKEFQIIKENIIKKTKRKDLNIINISFRNIENIKNISFETIVICENIKFFKEREEIINKICNNSKYIIINSDIEVNIKINPDKKINCITYGLNHKATITISSIQDEKALIYVQRNIRDIKGYEIEMGEISIKVDKKIKVSTILAIFSICCIYQN